jgi:hypothetical protein
MDLLGRFPDQEQSAGEQDEIPPAELMAEQRKQRLRQLHDPRDRAQKSEAQYQRAADADAARARALVFGQLVGQDRDEDQVVDAEHHLHGDEREERHPCRRIGSPGKPVGHARYGAGAPRNALSLVPGRMEGWIMSKGMDKKKEQKKKPQKSLEEKRAAKREKRAAKGYL